MTILDEINARKRQEIKQAMAAVSTDELRARPLFTRPVNSLKMALKEPGASGIIAEFKTSSPSRGLIHAGADVTTVTTGYVAAGASGLSVLTDTHFFGGSTENLEKARRANPHTPILRKDFILHPYQLYEAKARGADVVLLIAASLGTEDMLELARTAREIGLEVLAELHAEEEMEKLNPYVDLVGINNRNLKTFAVDLETSVRLSRLLPRELTRISESGLSSPGHIRALRQAGFEGFLMGETFMKTPDPAVCCRAFIQSL
ncbi:MAG: indole-3-glycerol phosphate synthase TrpC [Mangrovibacterium sp.]